jgi:FMN phosphatase YigB (HAD superfamily)
MNVEYMVFNVSFSGFHFRFDAVIISSEVGYEKPDPRIFQAALGMWLLVTVVQTSFAKKLC